MKRYALLLLFALATLALVPGCARLAAAEPGGDNTIEIVMDEYGFTPDVIRLEAGQTVTIRLRNEGQKMHEFMAGRDIQIHENLTEGFGEDFFAGLDVEIKGPGMVMGMEGEGMEMDMGTGEQDGEMAMGEAGHAEEGQQSAAHDEGDAHDEGMEMSGAEHDEAAEIAGVEETGAHDEGGDGHEEEMEMGGKGTERNEAMEEMPDEHGAGETGEAGHAEAETAGAHDEEGGEHEEEEGIVAGRFGAVQMPLMDAHAGLMIMIDPQMIPAGEATTITFTVPETKTGTWEIGCFQERGQHYDDGMNGLIIVDS